MGETTMEEANPNPSSPSQSPPPPPPGFRSSFQRPGLRVTSEYDSDCSAFFHKVSCKFLDSFAKLKLSFRNSLSGEVSCPQLGFITKNLAVLYDFESQNALVKGAFNVGSRLQFRGSHDVNEEQGEVSLIACLADPSYKFELSSSLPPNGMPTAAFRFPHGEVTLMKKEADVKDAWLGALSINTMLRSQVMDGVLTAYTGENDMCLRYSYKDEEMTFIPSLSLPSNALSFAFKRRFSSSDKLSYWYHFNTNDWSAVYKRTVGKDLKFKAGYDSDVRLGWASLWVGDEAGKAKTAPMKMKVQVMLQMPQDDLANSVVLFRVKKRWDF